MKNKSDMWPPHPKGSFPTGWEYKKECSLKPQNILLPGVRRGVQGGGQYGSTKSGKYIHRLGSVVKCFPSICEDLGWGVYIRQNYEFQASLEYRKQYYLKNQTTELATKDFKNSYYIFKI